MKKVLKEVIVITGIMAMMPNAFAQVNELSVKQAVDYAIKNSVQVRNALLDLKIQRETNREITAMAYPQLNGSGTVNDFLNIPTTLVPASFSGGAPGTYVPITFGTKYNATGGFDLSQILFDGQVLVGLQARKASLEFFGKQVDVTSELIKVNVQKIYYQLVVGYKQVTSIDANIDRFEKLLNDTREIYRNGFAEKLDVDKVNVQLNNLRTEKVKVQSQLDAGNAALKFLLNMPQKEKLVLTDTLNEDELKSGLLDKTYSPADRKEYQLLELALQLNKYNVKRYRLSYLPVLSAFGSYSKNAQRGEFDFFKNGSWFTTSLIGLKLQVPIFDGFAKKARVNRAKLEVEKSENNLEQIKASIDNDIEQSNLKITAALVTMDNQKQNMNLAEQVFNSTKLKYDQGLGSNQEIYNAQTELKVAQNNYYSALYDAIIAKIDFLKAAGKL
ncbi:MAG TPA: TolC family protein [Ferruginibacter sp.]|nr:TolC family protein [Ferruginibacter sp.]